MDANTSRYSVRLISWSPTQMPAKTASFHIDRSRSLARRYASAMLSMIAKARSTTFGARSEVGLWFGAGAECVRLRPNAILLALEGVHLESAREVEP